MTVEPNFTDAFETLQIGVVGEDRIFRVLTPAEVKDYLSEVE